MKASMNAWQKETTACQEAMDKMDTTDLEANQEKSDDIAKHQEEPKEEAAVETIRALEDQQLATGHCRQPKQQTQGHSGSLKKLAAAPMLHRTRDTVVRGQARTMLFTELLKDGRLRCLGRPKRNNGIRDQGLRQRLHLGSKRAFNKTVRQAFGLEAVKQVVGISIGLLEVSDVKSTT
jgi:hypothetical protein